jgi:hypothetical protein
MFSHSRNPFAKNYSAVALLLSMLLNFSFIGDYPVHY